MRVPARYFQEFFLQPPAVKRLAFLHAALVSALALAFSSCQSEVNFGDAAAMQTLSQQPMDAQSWDFGAAPGTVISTGHYRVYTTIHDPLYQHLISKTLEAAHTRFFSLNPSATLANPIALTGPMDCYVFGDRASWELYTKLKAGGNAPVYLQISAGGYCQQGVFAGYDIGREQTLSVIAHEAWHQYSWFAFKDRLPSWLEEGLATQNEAMEWNGTTPVFVPVQNYRRFMALRLAYRERRLWTLQQLSATHAGLVIRLPQADIDAYYAQLWSLVLFLEHNAKYHPQLVRLLHDASAGTLVTHLTGSNLSPLDIAMFSEHWNQVAGPIYLADYFNQDTQQLEAEYRSFVATFISTWPPRVPETQ